MVSANITSEDVCNQSNLTGFKDRLGSIAMCSVCRAGLSTANRKNTVHFVSNFNPNYAEVNFFNVQYLSHF